jgi:flagellar biosynthetic protein FliP
MMPPSLVSTPAKLILFVLADGWMLTAGALMNGFVVS